MTYLEKLDRRPFIKEDSPDGDRAQLEAAAREALIEMMRVSALYYPPPSREEIMRMMLAFAHSHGASEYRRGLEAAKQILSDVADQWQRNYQKEAFNAAASIERFIQIQIEASEKKEGEQSDEI